MIAAGRELWRSTGFRLAFTYGLLVAVTMLTSLAIVYLQTVGVLHQRMLRHVTDGMERLSRQYDTSGLDAVASAVRRALLNGQAGSSDLYLLLDADGRKLAGNLDESPARSPDADRDGYRTIVRNGQVDDAYVSMRTLANGGGLLVVGHDLRDQELIESLVRSASAAAGIVAALLLVGGTFVFRQELDRSVGAVRRTAARIAAGDLRQRVVSTAEGDEFAQLEGDINAMLDRIESLMDGVRHVSDTIAHNLRTPLTRVLMRLRELSAQAEPNDPRRAGIDAAIGDLEELAIVFEKLLQIAEVEAGARRRHFGPVSLHAIADDVWDLYEAVAEDRGMVLVREQAEPATALGDRDLLAGALVNLVENALKYAGSGATVRIGTQTLGGRARLHVRDSGPGIPSSERDRVGARFHRLDPAVPGHGLGLASVRAVAALHGGRLQLSDARPGLDACIDLPAQLH